MRKTFYIFLLAVSIRCFAGTFYNTNTGVVVYNDPNPISSPDGRLIFNPTPADRAFSGWLKLVTNSIPFGFRSIETNYTVGFPHTVIFTNAMWVTNISIKTRPVAYQSFTLLPIVVDKPSFVVATEMQYIATWHYLFGASNYGYTNAAYDEVAIAIMQIAQTNPSVLSATHAMERSFLYIRDWWTTQTEQVQFHPYPWGINTNIAIKDYYF